MCGQLGCGVSTNVINHPLSIFFFPIHDQQQLRTAGRPLTMTGAMEGQLLKISQSCIVCVVTEWSRGGGRL